jgi:protein-S-isoprenylcysteine O-methyltransferase Ste14
MSEIQTLSIPGEEPRNGFLQRLMDPSVDRTIAIVAVLPMVWAAYYRYHHFGLNPPVIYYFINTFVLVLTMALRRPAKRITSNLWFWLLAFVNTYFPAAILPFMDRGRPLISPLLTNVISITALLFTVWARLSLGRNIGFVPAQREIVTEGAYRYVRHPIYTGLMLSFLAVALRIYSPRNVTLLAIGIFWMLIKSLVEESFLRADPQLRGLLGAGTSALDSVFRLTSVKGWL